MDLWTSGAKKRGTDTFTTTCRTAPRNEHWHHLYNGDVISKTGKWEYPKERLVHIMEHGDQV
jgi:hypothetical protein